MDANKEKHKGANYKVVELEEALHTTYEENEHLGSDPEAKSTFMTTLKKLIDGKKQALANFEVTLTLSPKEVRSGMNMNKMS